MRIKEIEARLAAIKQEIEQRGDAMTAAEIDALEQETTQLTEERAGLIAAAEKRNGILDNIAKGAGIVSRSFQQNNGDDNAAPDDPFGTPEYRSAWLKNIRRLPLNDAEKRAFSNASGAGAEVIPTQTANEIISKVKTLAPMLNEVTLLHVKGAVKFAIEGTNNAAAIHTENASITAAADTLVQAVFNNNLQASKKIYGVQAALPRLKAGSSICWRKLSPAKSKICLSTARVLPSRRALTTRTLGARPTALPLQRQARLPPQTCRR